MALEQRRYAPSTINSRLSLVGRLAYEAPDCGLLSPDLAAGIRRVKELNTLVYGLATGFRQSKAGRSFLHRPILSFAK
jgi:hypothetical protein